MPLNFALAGKRYDPVEVKVTAESIAAYAEASGDHNPRYRPGPDQVASPVFPVVPGFPEMGRVTTDPELGVDNPLMIVHGEQEFRYHRLLRPEEPLTLHTSLERVEDKGKGATFVTRVSAAGADGEPVVDSWATIFVRGGGSGIDRPRQSATPPTRGEVVATFRRTVDVDMPARYAAASGDHNPIHLDHGVATAVGLPGVINHGLGTLSLVSGGLVDEVAQGDPGRLRHLQCRFTDMVLPGSDLQTTVWRAATGTDTHLFETVRPDGIVVISGAIEVA